MKKIILLLALALSSYTLFADYALHSSVFGGGATSTGTGYKLSGSVSQPNVGLTEGTGYSMKVGFWAAYLYKAFPVGCESTVYVDGSYTDQTEGWQVTHFSTLADGLAKVCAAGTLNVSNVTHDAAANFTGLTVIIGAQDVAITGEITGTVQTPSTGKLVVPTQGGSNTYPLTDGSTGNGGNDGNYTVQITPTGSTVFNVKITPRTDLDEEKQASGMLSNTLFEIEPETGSTPTANIVFRIPDASIDGGTLPENVIFRFWDGSRYKAIDANKVSIVDHGTYYIVTIEGVNEF